MNFYGSMKAPEITFIMNISGYLCQGVLKKESFSLTKNRTVMFHCEIHRFHGEVRSGPWHSRTQWAVIPCGEVAQFGWQHLPTLLGWSWTQRWGQKEGKIGFVFLKWRVGGWNMRWISDRDTTSTHKRVFWDVLRCFMFFSFHSDRFI